MLCCSLQLLSSIIANNLHFATISFESFYKTLLLRPWKTVGKQCFTQFTQGFAQVSPGERVEKPVDNQQKHKPGCARKQSACGTSVVFGTSVVSELVKEG